MQAQGEFNDKVVRQFVVMTVVWGVVGMLVGVVIAAQLDGLELNFDVPWLSHGRLRPLHANAVGFFLTAGFLGMMYYFVPKRAQRPVYSYRLSVVHFLALIFTYMWAGPRITCITQRCPSGPSRSACYSR